VADSTQVNGGAQTAGGTPQTNGHSASNGVNGNGQAASNEGAGYGNGAPNGCTKDPASMPLTLEILARQKALPVEFLESLGVHTHESGCGVNIPVFGLNRDDDPPYSRERDTPTCVSKGRRFYQPYRVSLLPYGLWELPRCREKRFATITEGESDCWTMWYYGLPAFALPGNGTYNKLEAEHVDGLHYIYIAHDTDQAGDNFVKGVAARLARIGFSGRVHDLRMPPGHKDISDLHVANPADFLRQIQRAIETSASVTSSPPKPPKQNKPDAPDYNPGEPNLTDRGNGMRLARAHADSIRWVDPWRRWLHWDGKRWCTDEVRLTTLKAKEVLVAMLIDAGREIVEVGKLLEAMKGVDDVD
jgi:hypothetical protein